MNRYAGWGGWLTLPQVRALSSCSRRNARWLIRKTFSSGYPFEDVYSYARAVRVGDHVVVSGTTARPPHLDGDAYQHITSAIAMVAKALGEAEAELLIARARGETFGGRRRTVGPDVTPDLASGLSPYISPVRNGLVRRSWPMLEPAPWPQMKPTSSPSGSSLSLIDLIRVA